MNEPKFTPEPWTAVQHGDGIYTWTIRGNDEMEERTLAIVGVGTPNLQRDKANMHLISAAPEMYKELQSFCKICDTHICALCGIGKVLRKARGESEEESEAHE